MLDKNGVEVVTCTRAAAAIPLTFHMFVYRDWTSGGTSLESFRLFKGIRTIAPKENCPLPPPPIRVRVGVRVRVSFRVEGPFLNLSFL